MGTPRSSNFRKYQTKNPVVRRLIRSYFQVLLREIDRIRPRKILDLGCGEGIVAHRILSAHPNVSYVGYDNSHEAIEEAKNTNPTGQFHCADILRDDSASEGADLVICLEVLEHMADPEVLLKRIQKAAVQTAIVSVPWEPFFRLGSLGRGLYLSRLGNHPEHVQTFNRRSLAKVLETCFSEVYIETSFPWLFGRCKP